MTPWVNLGYQWDCEKSDQDGLCEQASDGDLSNHMGDGYENPDRRGRIFSAARSHTKRTGHKTTVDRHSRFTIKAYRGDGHFEGCTFPASDHSAACRADFDQQQAVIEAKSEPWCKVHDKAKWSLLEGGTPECVECLSASEAGVDR